MEVNLLALVCNWFSVVICIISSFCFLDFPFCFCGFKVAFFLGHLKLIWSFLIQFMLQKRQLKAYEDHSPGSEAHSLPHSGWSWNIKLWYTNTLWPMFQFLHTCSSLWRKLSTHMLFPAFPLDPIAPVHVRFFGWCTMSSFLSSFGRT